MVKEVTATLKGTGIAVAFALTQKQFAHFQKLRGIRPKPYAKHSVMDQHTLGEMKTLLEHLKCSEDPEP